MAKKFWWPKRIADQMQVVTTFKTTFPKVANNLGFTPEDVTYAIEVCDSILASYQFVEDLSASAKAATSWRNHVFYGEQTGFDATVPPSPLAPAAVRYIEGSVDLFFKFRSRVMASPNYAPSFGYDLGLIGPEKMRLSSSDASPDLDVSVSSGNMLNIAGSLKGCDALRVEYAPEGAEFSTIAFLTRTPYSFQLKTQQPGIPEKGSVRAVFIKANEPFGSYTGNYPILLW